MVAKRVQGTTTLRCTLYMHLLHYLSMRQRSAGTKRKEWLLIEKGRWPSFQHMYLPCQLHSYSTFHALIKQPSHITCKITDTILSTPVRPSFRKAPVTSTMSRSSTWKGQGQFILFQSLLVGLARIASLTRCRWGARHPTCEQVLGLFLVGCREPGTLKWLLTIGCLNMWLQGNL